MHPTDSQSLSVSSRCQGSTTVITLSRPDVRNAVDADTARALYAAFLTFEEDADAKVAVFHGAHGHFCAGWDLKAGARMARDEGGPGVLTNLDFEPLSGAQPPCISPAQDHTRSLNRRLSDRPGGAQLWCLFPELEKTGLQHTGQRADPEEPGPPEVIDTPQPPG